jgi:hypothetical protein
MTATQITATAYVTPTLHAPVRVLGDLSDVRVWVETLPGGVGGWATPGRRIQIMTYLLRDVNVEEPEQPAVVEPPPLAAPISGEDYIALLVARRDAWEARNGGARPYGLPALIEWFIQDGDEEFVQLPGPAPKRERKPRVYRSAASLRKERDTVQARMDRITGEDTTDGAVVNLSPFARSRAARNAGRARFAKLDRDLERYTALRTRLDNLNSRIRSAEARESVVDEPS